MKSALVDQPCSFAIENHDKSSHGDIKIVITSNSMRTFTLCIKMQFGLQIVFVLDPKGGRTPSKITINSNNSWNVEFTPTEIGKLHVN